MQASFTFTGTPETYIASRGPDVPILFFDPPRCTHGLRCFSRASRACDLCGKANDTSEVIENLHMAG